MIRTNKQWNMWCHEHGTSGEQVFQILRDWRESEGIVNQDCKWTLISESESDDTVDFETECGSIFVSSHSWPREDGFNFCPYCGNIIDYKFIMQD